MTLITLRMILVRSWTQFTGHMTANAHTAVTQSCGNYLVMILMCMRNDKSVLPRYDMPLYLRYAD